MGIIKFIKKFIKVWKYLEGVKKKGDFYNGNQPPEPKFYMRKEAFKIIEDVLGWKTNREIAHHIDLTETYISEVRNRKKEVHTELFKRLNYVMNLLDDEWKILFEFVQTDKPYNGNSQKWNYLKEIGVMPYRQFSLSSEMRNAEERPYIRTYKSRSKVKINLTN